jgi:predicted metal-dependent phosphoesterase TrpH
MEIDLHTHTNRYSGCSNIHPLQLIRRAKEVGLEGIGITEHGIRWSDENIEALREESRAMDFLILPGQEVACYTPQGRCQGEFLVFGYSRSLGSSRSLEQILEMVHAEGGVVIGAHPFKKLDNDNGFYGAGETVHDFAIDGLEVEHPSYDEESRLLAWNAVQAMEIAGIGSSDAHDVRNIGICRTVFEGQVNDSMSLCREIRAGRVRAVNLMRVDGGRRCGQSAEIVTKRNVIQRKVYRGD